jgi:hypothetical protein
MFGDLFELDSFGELFEMKLSVLCLEWNCLAFCLE